MPRIASSTVVERHLPPHHAAQSPAPPGGRARILDAALRLFAEEGFEVPLRRIAAEAKVAFSLIRLHFGSKSDLQAAVERTALEPIERAMLASEARVGASDFLSTALEDAAELLATHLPSYAILRRAVLDGGTRGDRILRRYLHVQRRYFHALSEAGIVSTHLDSNWGSLIQMFVGLGPVLAQPFVEGIAEGRLSDTDFTRGLKQTWGTFLVEHCGDRDDLPASPRVQTVSPRKKAPKTRGYGSGRDRLLHTALRLSARHGWTAVSLRRIARTTGVSAALVSIHFGSKDGLRDAVDAHVVREFELIASSLGAVQDNELPDALFGSAISALHDRRDYYEYLARALLEGSETGNLIMERLYGLHRRLAQLSAGATKRPPYDRVWTPLITLLVSLGPAFFNRFIKQFFSQSLSDPQLAAAFTRTSRWMLTRPSESSVNLVAVRGRSVRA
jgi:AcrR family transcriptional regulator